jgi:diguanylate cyclase (GGDEF)-like protein
MGKEVVSMITYPEVSENTTDQELTEVFCKIGAILTSSLQPQEVIHRVMTLIGNYFSPENWSLLLWDASLQQLKFEIVMGIDASKLKGVRLEKGEGIVGWVCDNAEPTIVEDITKDARFSSRIDDMLDFKTRSIICVPLLNGNNEVVGAIELINKIVAPSCSTDDSHTYDNFTQNDMKILSAIATFTGIAVENAFLFKQVEELAMIDSLTGINNRYYFNEILRQETEKVKRYDRTMCMLMMDVDDFKKINDSYGHLTGDRILQSIADILRVTVRESDFLARFGGDEFVIIMPESKEKDALGLAKRIQDMIIRWNKKETTHGPKIQITIGIHEAGSETIDQILSEADKDLYHKKVFSKKPEELTSIEEMQHFLDKKFED